MIDELATALVEQLNNQAWSKNFTAVFDDAPLNTMQELESLHVIVMPFSVQTAPMNKLGQKPVKGMRGIETYLNTIDISIQQLGPARPTTGTDPITVFSAGLRTLTQEILHWLNQPENKVPASYQTNNRGAWIRTIEPMPLYDVSKLREQRLYIGILRVTYEEHVRE